MCRRVRAVQGELKWGLPTDCPTNPLCAGALKDSYGVDTTSIDLTLLDARSTPMADALKTSTIDFAELCSSGPEIIVNGWVRLEDDKNTQPALVACSASQPSSGGRFVDGGEEAASRTLPSAFENALQQHAHRHQLETANWMSLPTPLSPAAPRQQGTPERQHLCTADPESS